MGRSDHTAQTKQASRLLRDFLESRPDYRRQWQEHAERRRSDGVSLAGTSRVIALYLWGSGERSDSETTLPRDLKDRVRRALTGQGITPRTLSWFIEAFGMAPRDEQSLWAAFAGDGDPTAGISCTISTTDAEPPGSCALPGRVAGLRAVRAAMAPGAASGAPRTRGVYGLEIQSKQYKSGVMVRHDHGGFFPDVRKACHTHADPS